MCEILHLKQNNNITELEMSNEKIVNFNKTCAQNARRAANHKQITLAEELNISRRHLIRIENGENVSEELAKKIANELGVSLKHLQGEENLDEYDPFSWVTKYPKGTKKLNREQKLGKTFSIVPMTMEYINEEINDLIKQDKYRLNRDQIIAILSLDEEKNSYFLDLETYYKNHNIDNEKQRYEIKLFEYNKHGMEWNELTGKDHSFMRLCVGTIVSPRVTKYIDETKRG